MQNDLNYLSNLLYPLAHKQKCALVCATSGHIHHLFHSSSFFQMVKRWSGPPVLLLKTQECANNLTDCWTPPLFV